MYNALTLFAVILSVACAVLIQHVLVRFNRNENTLREWSQALSDDCNAAIDSRYHIIMDAVRKDVESVLNEVLHPVDSDVVEYIEVNDIELGSEVKNNED